MTSKTFRELGISFYYDQFYDGVTPHIPRVPDVLFALQLLSSDQEKSYICRSNTDTYLTNVHQAAVAVSFRITAMRPSEEEQVRIIACAIIDLCPKEAHCLCQSEFVEAKRLIGDPVPAPNTDIDALRDACTCLHCRYVKETLAPYRAK